MTTSTDPTQPTDPTPPTEPDELPDTVETMQPPSPTRKRVRWYHVAVLGVAVLACAAAIGFSTSQASDRDDASSARRAAQARLVDQRADTRHARETLLQERDDTKSLLDDAQAITGTLQQLNDVSAQEVAALTTLHQLAINSPDAVDEFNAQYDKAQALGIQMYAKATSIEDQIAHLRQNANSQFASVLLQR